MKVRIIKVKKNNVLAITTVLQIVVIGITMLLVKLTFDQRGYMAFGGEWGLLVTYNIFVFFLTKWLNDNDWVFVIK